MKEHKFISIIYVLLALFFVAWFLPVLGLLMAYFVADGETSADASHLRYQKRTFWIGVLLKFAGLAVAGIIVLLALGVVETLARLRDESLWFGMWDGSYHMMLRFRGHGHEIWDGIVQVWGPGLVYSLIVLFALYFLALGLWWILRCIKGFVRARRKKAIDNPATWWI